MSESKKTRSFSDPKDYIAARRLVTRTMRLYPLGVRPSLVSQATGLSIAQTTEVLVREAKCSTMGVWL